MLEINWKQDYHSEFVCPSCEKSKLGLCGFKRGERQFVCLSCKSRTLASVKLSSRSRYLESGLKDEHVDWGKDYHGEFICPKCDKEGMSVWGVYTETGKRVFKCSSCRKTEQNSCAIGEIKRIEDRLNPGVVWYTNHRIKSFVCPECHDQNMYLDQADKRNKKRFRCRTCKKYQYDSLFLSKANISQYSDASLLVKVFNLNDNKWDLRSINPNFDIRDDRYFLVDFIEFELTWYKCRVKDYIFYLCKVETALGTIGQSLSSLRIFSRYLSNEHISSFDEINRDVILDYLAKEQKITKHKLSGLRKFFTAGNIKGWFSIDPDIIRDADYPKQYQGNPDPISDTVRKRIEESLHLLPDPIARMWLIGYFSAMRPSELALLRKDC